MKNNTKQTGMTLIEIMIALLIGVFLLGGIIQIFIGSKQTYRMQENLSRLQENGRMAMSFLSKDIRMSGYQGCPSLKTVTPNVAAGILPVLGLNTLVWGADNVANNWNANACGAGNACIAGTDTIRMVYGDSCGGNLTAAMANANANIQISVGNTCNIKANDALLVSNCSTSDAFLATANGTPIQPQTALSSAYSTDAELFIYRTYTYYIRESSTQPQPLPLPANRRRSLWRLDNTLAVSAINPVELVEGVENMQITYGVDGADADVTPDYYVPANLVANWSQVVSVRITITVRTIDGNLTSTPLVNEGRIDHDFTSTIALRNRLP